MKIRRILAAVLTAAVIVGSIPVSELSVFAQEIGQVETGTEIEAEVETNTEIEAEVETNTEIEAEVETNKEVKIGTEDDAGVNVFSIEEDGIEDSDVTDKNVAVETEEVIETESDSSYNLLDDSQFDASLMLTGDSDYESAHFVAYYGGELIASEDVKKGESFRYKSGSYIAITGLGSQSEGNTGTLDTNYVCVSINENGGSGYPSTLYGSGYCWGENQELFSLGERNIKSVQIEAAQLETSKIACVSNIPECDITYSVADKVGDHVKIDYSKRGEVRVNIGIPEGYEFTSGTFDATFKGCGIDNGDYQLHYYGQLYVDRDTNEYCCVLDFQSLAFLAHIVDDWPSDKFNINVTVTQMEEGRAHSNYTVNCSDEYGDKHYKLLPAQSDSNIVKDSSDNKYYIVDPAKPIKVVLTPEQYYDRKDAPYVFVGNDRVDVDWNSYWYGEARDQLNSEFTIENLNYVYEGNKRFPFDGNVRITDGSETDGNEDGYIPTIVEPASSDYWFSADNDTLGKYGNWNYCVESTTFYDGAGNQVSTPSFELRQDGNYGKLSDVTLGSTVRFKIKMKPGMVLNSVTRVWYEDEEGKRYGTTDYSEYNRYHGDVLKADENGIYSFEANASYTWIYINAEPEGNYCDDGKVKLAIEPSGFTKVTMTEVIGTRDCTLKLYRKGNRNYLSKWTYNFKNSNPGNVMWIFVDPDKKSWYSKWTYKDIVKDSGTYYVTLETQGKVYRSADFVYTEPENKLDAPNPDSFYVEWNESGWGRYLHWDDINNDKCAGYEFEAESAENGKSSNFMMFYPNDKFGYCIDNMYNALDTGKWTIRIRAISNDINEVTVGDWTEYEYTMTKRVPAVSVTLSDTSMSLYMENGDSSADITAVVNPAETVTLTGVSWKSSNEKVAKIEQVGNNEVKVTAVGLGTAKIVATTFDSANKSASCTVTVRQSRPVVSFTGINSDIHLYTPGVNNVLGQLGEVLSADENGNVCLNSDYGETICFAPIPTDDNHEIDTVKVGTKALSAVKGKYEDNGVTKDITYYKLSNITRSQTVNITQKARAMTTDDYFELDQSNAQNSKFATSVATAGENGKYYFKKDTRNLTFTVTSDIAHAPVVSIGHHDEGGFVPEETLHGTLKTDDKYTKRIYTYKIEAFKASGKVIQITDQDAPKKQLRVEVQPAAVLEPVVKIGADTKTFEEEESEPGAGIYVYSIPEFSTVAVSYAFKEGKSDSYRLTGITVNEKAQATAVVNKGTVSTVVADDSDVHFTATGITTMFLTKDGDTEIIFNNGVAKLGSRDTATLQIRNGDSTEEPLALSSNSEIACVVKAGRKDVPGFATVSDDKKTVTIDAKTAAILNKNPVTVTLQGDDFAKQTIKFNVEQLVSGITAKNFNFDKSTQQNKATQNAGTVATYALTFAPKSAPLDNIRIKKVDGSDENGQVFLATESNGNKVLSVETFKDNNKDNKIATKPLMVQFYDDAGTEETSDDIDIGLPFVITPSAKFAAPTVKLLSATDIGMKLSLKAPKGLEQYKNLYYEISATPKSPVSDKMIAEGLVVHEPINAMETELILAKGIETVLGDGAAQKYDVSVKIVQVIENKENIGEVIFDSDNIFTPQAGAIKKMTASTKAPYYETNLTLKGKKVTFTQGETTPGFDSSGLYVAMAKFSSATTFASVDPEKSYVAGADGKKIDGADILVGPDGVSIWISNTSVIPVGKATLVVAPLAHKGAQYKNATLALKVKAPIDKISLTQSGAMSSGDGTKLFKKQGTAAKIKFTATPLWDGDDLNSDSWFKPASTKVEWTLTAPSGSSLLDNKNATIDKSGTVTISKDYICNNTELDKFTVTAKAADFTGNTVSASMEVTLTSKAIELVTAKVVNDLDEEVNVSSASPKDLIGKTLKFYDKDGNWIDPINLVYKVKPEGIGFDSKGKIVSVSKAGSFTVTATSLDGGKSSLATTITNAGLTIGSAKVFVWDNADGKYKEVTDYDTVDSSTFGYISFYDEEENAIKCSDLKIEASKGLTLTINSPDSNAAFITAVKQPGTYNVTATTKDGGKKLVKDITFTETTEGYEVTKLTYSSGSNNTNVFETIPKLLDNPSGQEATVSNANAICLDVFRTDSGVYPYHAKVTVSGGKIITKTAGTIWDNDGKVRQGGKYVIKPTKDVVDIIVNGGGKKAVYKIKVISGKGKALKANKLTKTEFIGATTASYDTSFTFETSEFKADDSKEYSLVFTPNEAYHKAKTDKERNAYDTLAALLEEAGNEVETTSITPTSGAVFKTKTLKDYGSVPVGSYKFDVTAVQVIKHDGDSIIELKPLTKPLTVTFKANAPKAISAKLNNSGKVTIDDTASASAQIPFVSNSAYSSIINTETDKPILYNNNDKGVISSFKKYFDVTVSDDKLILMRKSGEDAKYNWTEAETKKGNTAIVGWVEYTVVGQDGITKRTYCEKVTATLKYKGN